MAGDLAAPGSGEEGDEGSVAVAGGRMSGLPGADAASERMSDEGGRDAAFAEPGLLEGEDTKKLAEIPAHGPDAAFAPGPGLGGDHLDDGDPLVVKGARHTGMKGLVVDEDGEIGLFGVGGGDQAAVFAEDRGQMGDDFGEADDGELRRIDDGADTGASEAIARGAKEGPLGMTAAQGVHEGRGVEFTGGFAGRHEEVHLFR